MARKIEPEILWKKVPFKGYLYASLILDIFLVLAIFLIKNFLPPEVPLFYGLPKGRAELVPTLGLLIVPLVSFVILLLNTIIASFIADQFIKKSLVISSFITTIILSVAVFKIILLIGFF